MYIYILTGRIFGKDIYEISYTRSISERLNSEIYGFNWCNEILFKREILFLDDVEKIEKLIRKSFSEFHMKKDCYKIKLDQAIRIVNDLVNAFDVDKQKTVVVEKEKQSFIRSCFLGQAY
jgi:hypothetical protein